MLQPRMIAEAYRPAPLLVVSRQLIFELFRIPLMKNYIIRPSKSLSLECVIVVVLEKFLAYKNPRGLSCRTDFHTLWQANMSCAFRGLLEEL